MATRSQVSSHPYWGLYASTAQLPNVSGASVQSANVQQGDTAAVGSSLYVCTTATVGAAVWAEVGSTGGRSLWKWNRTDVTQFTQDYIAASMAGTLLVETPSKFGNPLLVWSKGVTAGSGFVYYVINDFTIPTSGRFVINVRMGPRSGGGSAYGTNVTPYLVPMYQDETHAYRVARRSASTGELRHSILNNNATESVMDVGAISMNNDDAAPIQVEMFVRQPSGVDPAFHSSLRGFTQAAVPPNSDVSGLDPGFSGGAPPHSSGWHASWQSEVSKVAVAFECATGAGKSFLADFTISQHPLDEA